MMPGAVAAAMAAPPTPVLDTATAWWSPSYYEPSGDIIYDRKALNDLRVGASVGADAADPTRTTDGTYNILQLRTDDYLRKVSAVNFDPGTGGFTALIVAKMASVAGTQIIMSKRTGAVLGWNLFANATTLSATIDDDVAAAVTATHGTALGTSAIYGMAARRNGSAWQVILDGVAGTAQTPPSNTIDNAEDFRIGRGGGATTAFANIDVYGAAWWKGTAVSDANLTAAKAELLAVAAVI